MTALVALRPLRRPTLAHWVDAFAQKLGADRVRSPRLFLGNLGPRSECHRLVLAGKLILPSPELCAIWLNAEKKPSAVREKIGLCLRLGLQIASLEAYAIGFGASFGVHKGTNG
jgi:hypothetical protein